MSAAAQRTVVPPTGTVTFFFSDIEGSTRLLDQLGARFADVLQEHRRALRDAIAPHGGVERGTGAKSILAGALEARRIPTS